MVWVMLLLFWKYTYLWKYDIYDFKFDSIQQIDLILLTQYTIY